MKKIAFFGLGNMGEPMARNLLKAGYELTTAVHRNREPAERLETLGLKICNSPAEAVADVEVIIEMMSSDEAVLNFFKDSALVDAIKPGTIILEMSSCAVETVKELYAFYREKGVEVIDAPVSGGPTGAAEATLSIICGGDQVALGAVDEILKAMGKNIYHLGKCGSGKLFKNLNNTLLLINVRALLEVREVLMAEGIDIKTFIEVASHSSGNSFALPVMATFTDEMKYGPMFANAPLLATKDLGNTLKINPNVSMPTTEFVYNLYKDEIK